ncbi:GNAT family N-acetyltransferase [soil metagenome]
MKIEVLNEEHDSSSFRCGEKDLDRYLKRFALSNGQEGYGTTFVATESGRDIQGYYTLSNSRVSVTSMPSEEQEGMPRYDVPSVLLAKLAVHREFQGRGLGRILLFDAFHRFLAIGRLSGARLFEVDALNESAKAFYLARGFADLLDDPLHLYITKHRVAAIVGM